MKSHANGTMPKQDPRKRERVDVIFDLGKPEEKHWVGEIKRLKKTRGFKTFLIGAFNLYADLKNGSTERLMNMFGHLVMDLVEQISRDRLSQMEAEHAAKLTQMEQAIAALNALVANGGIVSVEQRVTIEPRTPRYLVAENVLPDDEPTVIVTVEKVSGKEMAANFVSSVGGFFD